ncbi:hypothetical protein Plhal304r1_c021g0075571 [Plasmopara halstedii]
MQLEMQRVPRFMVSVKPRMLPSMLPGMSFVVLETLSATVQMLLSMPPKKLERQLELQRLRRFMLPEI